MSIKNKCFIIISIFLATLLCSCGQSDTGNVQEVIEAKYNYNGEEEILNLASENMPRHFKMEGETVYYNDIAGNLHHMADGRETSLKCKSDIYVFDVTDNIYGVSLNEDSNWCFVKASLDGVIQTICELKDDLTYQSLPIKIVSDLHGNSYLWYMDQNETHCILVLDKNGKKVASIDAGEQVFDMARSCEGDIYVTWQTKKMEVALGTITPDTKMLEKIEIVPGNGSLCTGIERGILLYDNHFLYEYQPDTKQCEAVINWIDCYVNGALIQEIAGNSWEELRLILWNSNTPNAANEPITLKQLHRISDEEKEVAERTRQKITLYKTGTDYTLPELIMEFNRQSADYEVVLEESEVASDNAQFFLNTRLMTGDCPDMILIDYYSYELYKNAGALADLSVYMAKTDQMNVQDFFEPVMQPFWEGDALYGLPLEFTVKTLVGKRSRMNELIEKNVKGMSAPCSQEKFLLWLEAHPETKIKFDGEPTGITRYCLYCDLEQYVNFENKSSNLSSDAFKTLISKASGLRYDTNYFDSNKWLEEVSTNQTVLSEEELYGFSGLISLEKSFGPDLLCLGYPNTDGTLKTLLYPHQIIGIASHSKNKEGAWAFWQYYMEKREYLSFPANHNTYNTEKQKALDMEKDSKGTYELNVDVLEELIRAGNIYPPEQDMVIQIILEELNGYYYQDKSIETVLPVLENRVNLYLKEQ